MGCDFGNGEHKRPYSFSTSSASTPSRRDGGYDSAGASASHGQYSKAKDDYQ